MITQIKIYFFLRYIPLIFLKKEMEVTKVILEKRSQLWKKTRAKTICIQKGEKKTATNDQFLKFTFEFLKYLSWKFEKQLKVHMKNTYKTRERWSQWKILD